MAIAFDAVGAGGYGDNTTFTWSHTATAGADAFVWCVYINTLPSAVTYGGTTMTQVGSAFNIGFYVGSTYYLALWHLANVSGGASTVSVTGTAVNMKANSISYTGVGSIGTLVTNGATSGTAITSGSVTSATGDLVTNAMVDVSSGISSYSQTQRSSISGGSWGVTLLMGDAAGASTDTFTGTGAASALWGSASLNLVPASGGSYNAAPTTATVTITGGTPSITNAAGLQPTTATVTITGGTPAVIMGINAAPTTATVTITGDTPILGTFPPTPFGNVLPKLTTSGTTTILAIGDSTVYGYYDGANEGGWVGRLGLFLGQSSNSTAKNAAYAATVGYSGFTTEYTGTSGATIETYNGGVIGASLPELETWLSDDTLVPTQPDCIIIGIGINDLAGGESGATFVSAYQTFITNLRAACPLAPIVITTENVVDDTGDTGYWVNGFNAMTTWLCSQDIPISPPLQTTSIPGVWVLDTQQAYGDVWNSALMTNAEHPNATGYATQAQFMLDELADICYPTTATVAITGGTPAVTVGGPVNAAPTTATVTITGGTPVVSNSILISPTTATVTITPGTPTVTATGNYSASPATATVAITGNLGDIVNSSMITATASWPGMVTGTVFFIPVPESSGNYVYADIVDSALSVQLPIIGGQYLVTPGRITVLPYGSGYFSPFAFQCPASGSINLNEIVSSGAQIVLW